MKHGYFLRSVFIAAIGVDSGSALYGQALYGGGNQSVNMGGTPGACNNNMVITPNPVVTYEGEDTEVTFSVDKMFGALGGDSIRLSKSTMPNYNIQSGGAVWWGDRGNSPEPLDTEAGGKLTSTIQTKHHIYTQSGHYWVEGSMGADFKQNSPTSGSRHCVADANIPVEVLPTKPVAGKLSANGSVFWSQAKPQQGLKVDNAETVKSLNMKAVPVIVAARAYIDEKKGAIHFVSGTLISVAK